MVYADTSFFISLYGSDTHSRAARSLIASRPVVWFTPLHQAEWLHAIAQHVFRGALSPGDALQLQRHLEQDRSDRVWKETALPENALAVCGELALRHGPRLGVRTLDSLHVAAALELHAKRFWTFDERQGKLARAEGLEVKP
jgi:predicted nucleic acid-binding protein